MYGRLSDLASRGLALFAALLTAPAETPPIDEWSGMDWFIL